MKKNMISIINVFLKTRVMRCLFILILCDMFQPRILIERADIIKFIRYHQYEENFWRFFSLQQFVQVFVSKLIWLTKIKELMKNVCRCVLIFTNIVKVSLLVAHCAQVHMCSAVTLSKSDLQLFILNLHLGRCSYQLAAQTCLESDNNKAKLA